MKSPVGLVGWIGGDARRLPAGATLPHGGQGRSSQLLPGQKRVVKLPRPPPALCRSGIAWQFWTGTASWPAYPFLPHTIPLLQEIFNAMRGFKLSGTERSTIGLAQGTLRELADQPLGVLASLDLIFNQGTDELSSSDYLGGTQDCSAGRGSASANLLASTAAEPLASSHETVACG